MKKILAFVLCAALSCGFVGCGGETGSAKSLYKALSKAGDLTLEAEYKDVVSDFGGKIPILEKIVFRMPEETREINKERACYIETYPSADELEKAIGVLNESMESSDEKTYSLYSAGNTLLRIDGTVTENAVSKYVNAFQNAAGSEAALRNSKDLPVSAYEINRSFSAPGGIGAKEIYDAFKDKIKDIEFYSFMALSDYDNVSFFDQSQDGETVIVDIQVDSENHEDMDSALVKGRNIVLGNTSINFSEKLPDDRVSEYTKILEKIVK